MDEKNKEVLPEKMVRLESSWEDFAGEEIEAGDEDDFDPTHHYRHHSVEEDYGPLDGFDIGV